MLSCPQMWNKLRKTCRSLVVDIAFVLLYATYVLGSGALVCWLSFSIPFPLYIIVMATIEQVWCTFIAGTPVLTSSTIFPQLRLSMKTYSFVHENAYKVLHPWNKDDDSGIPLVEPDM